MNKHFPGYFNKRIFQFSVYLIAGLYLYLIFAEGILTMAYEPGELRFNTHKKIAIACPADAPSQCINPFYECDKVLDGSFFCESIWDERCLPGSLFELQCSQLENIGCKNNLCSKEFLQPGETIGERVGPLMRNFHLLMLFIVGMGALTNHIYYKLT